MRAAACLCCAALGACGGTHVDPAVRPSPTPRGDICAGLSDTACQDRALAQSLCLASPDDASCVPLRRAGWLPPAPPPLAGQLHCWRVDEPRDDLRTSWWCLGVHDVAIRSGGAWDVWPHGGWRREDTTAHAGWTTSATNGRTLWLTVLAPTTLHLSDGSGHLSVTLSTGDGSLLRELAGERAALPTPASVCAAARACIAARPRPAPPPSDAEYEGEIEGTPDPLAGATTLQDCEGAVAAWCPAPPSQLDLSGPWW